MTGKQPLNKIGEYDIILNAVVHSGNPIEFELWQLQEEKNSQVYVQSSKKHNVQVV